MSSKRRPARVEELLSPSDGPGATSPPRRVWGWMRRSTAATVMVVLVVLVLAAGLGLGAARALASSGGGTAPSGPTTTTAPTAGTSGNSGNSGTAGPGASPNGANSEESGAPLILSGAGFRPGYGAYNALACADSNHCVAVGADANGHAVVGTSTDGGSSWADQNLPGGSPVLGGVDCADAQHCVAVGQGAILTTSDGGTSWAMQPPPVPETTLVDVACPSSTCLAAGASTNPTGPYVGQIMRSTDSGQLGRLPRCR